MDVQTFAQHLPSLYHHWESAEIQPVSDRFQVVLEQLGGATPAVMQLLNAAVGSLAVGELYCEIGCLAGTHLIGALLDHPEQMAYAVESPARVSEEEIGDRLLEHLSAFGMQEQVFFCCQDTEEFFADLQAAELADRIGVYFYNGAADYRSILMGLLQVQPFLGDRALMVIGQADSFLVRQATRDFLATHPQAQLLFDLSAPQLEHTAFGYGVLVLGWDAVSDRPSASPDLPLQSHPVVMEAMHTLELQQRALYIESLRQEATAALGEGRFDAAEHHYRMLLPYDGYNPDVWQNLGMLYHLMGRHEEALNALEISLQLAPENPVALHVSGLSLEHLNRDPDAETAFRQALKLNPVYVDSLISLGELLSQLDRGEEAADLFQQAIATAPQQSAGYVGLGKLRLKQGEPEAAIPELLQAVKLSPNHVKAWQSLEAAYRAIGKSDKAQLCTVYNLAYQSQHQKAVEAFLEVFTIDQLDTYNDCLLLYNCFFQCGMVPEAIQIVERAATLRPEDQFLQLAPNFVLPAIYQDAAEMAAAYDRYRTAYQTLEQLVSRAETESTPLNVKAVENFTNFYLAYQGKGDRDIYACYGKMLHRVATERYPGLRLPAPLPPLSPNGKIRIGYIAESLGNNSDTRWAIGWLKNHDRSQFEIYCYSVEATTDLRAQQFRLLSDAFYHLPDNLDAICDRILADQPHILVFLALGNRVKINTIAALRLAPIQCSAWGHPVTSGLPTIDYYLSGDLMEPENAQEHYTEELVRLPNIGLSYPRPQLPAPSKTRADLGLPEDAVLYLSCQLVFKYLPQHDYLFPALVQRVPQAKLVFVIRSTFTNQINPTLERQFHQRLEQAFATAGLNMADHCIFLPGQDLSGYVSLLTCVDVFLDTIGFSGGHTTFDAITCNLPIVSCAGEVMRGRQSYAALTMLGVTDTIANSEAEYLNLAVRLGLEPAWRQDIAQRMATSQANLFDDTACVQGLEAFYQQAVATRLAATPSIFGDRSPDTKAVLHVGCGPYYPEGLPPKFRTPEWREVRLDINPAVRPDIIGSITDLSAVPDQAVEAVYSSHNLEHVYAHEVPIALAEFFRVLKPGGIAVITLPDIQKVAEYIAQGNLESSLYVSAAGPIAAIDILYGLRPAIESGNHFMAHRTAFTGDSLSQKLQEAGFDKVEINKEELNLWAVAHKATLDSESP
ncbi:tetratricopeptide repeat protein [Pantanalinema rosaneae CENA516]|uniref:O-linked N-acetylglucosamine transferase family protein n=1 Tax=Pantanalinema rosaneae TaxID=1620701 RepID=UPI003D6EBEBA